MDDICETCGWGFASSGGCNCCPVCGELITEHTNDELAACDELLDPDLY
ncbi:hypothetical protein AB0A73_24420 [Glycomyces sp. NPDC047369]